MKQGHPRARIGLFGRLLSDRRGVSTLEYGLYASLIALAAIQAIGGLGFEVSNSFDNSTEKLAQQNADLANRSINGPADPNGTTVDPATPDEPAAAQIAPTDQLFVDPVATTPDEPPVAAATMPNQ